VVPSFQNNLLSSSIEVASLNPEARIRLLNKNIRSAAEHKRRSEAGGTVSLCRALHIQVASLG
jgi:hypothetical protein